MKNDFLFSSNISRSDPIKRCIRCSFKFLLKFGVKESTVNAPRVSVVFLFCTLMILSFYHNKFRGSFFTLGFL
jgi:hypothetical protein